MDGDLLGILNRSGFPFQIRVAAEVQRPDREHTWGLEAEERWWEHENKSGFVDLVLSKLETYNTRRMPTYLVVECKRYQDMDWIFLPSATLEADGYSPDRVFVAGGASRPAWWQITVLQNGSELREGKVATYCAPKDNQTLEKLAGEVILATEGVAKGYHNLVPEGSINRQQPALFFPLIVTTARLLYCDFSAQDISLEEGTLDWDAANFVPLDFVRFRKTFKTDRAGEVPATSIRVSSYQERRTVWIVHVSHLTTLLMRWQAIPTGSFPLDLF